MTETLDTRRKRLLFRSWHRGTKEADLLLGSFAERHLASFTEAQLETYEARLATALAFFHPGIEILSIPAWDCLPYDRASPNTEIVSRRVDALTRLADAAADTGTAAGPRIVLTTVNALVQRVPPRQLFRGR